MRAAFSLFILINVGERKTTSSINMKRDRQLSRCLLPAAFAASLLCAHPSHAGVIALLKGGKSPSAPEPQKVGFVGCAKVKEVAGDVKYLAGVEKWEPLKPGMHLREGDLVQTQNGRVVIQMCRTTSLVSITPETTLRLVALNNDSKQEENESVGFIVRSAHGKSFYRENSEEWKAIEVNSLLPSGAVVRTDKQAYLSLFDTSVRRATHILGGVEKRLGDSPSLASTRQTDTLTIAGGR